MTPTRTLTEEDLYAGVSTSGDAELVIGEDFYNDEPDASDGSYRDEGDPISQAVGTPGYMQNHMVQDCFEQFGDGARTEPEEFDRYYFPPQEDGYDGPAPVLIDILQSEDPADQAREREEKHCRFKAAWCAERNVRYIVLEDLDELLSTGQLRAKILGETPPAASTLTEVPNPLAPTEIVPVPATPPAAAAAGAPAPAAAKPRKSGGRRGRRGVQRPAA